MKIIIRAELVTDWGESTTIDVAHFDRPIHVLAPESLGLSLDDGKNLLFALQQIVIPAQTDEYCELRRVCSGCRRRTRLNDYRRLKMDTVFGTVSVRSPRLMSCRCDPPFYLETLFSPLAQIIPERAAPDLLVLQTRLAAKMSYRQVVSVMKEFLPSPEKLNHVTVRNRTLRVGARVDGIDLSPSEVLPTETAWSIAIDGGFVRVREQARPASFEILTGRLSAPGVKPHVFACVRSAIPSMAGRLAMMLQARTGSCAPQVCVITDGAIGLQGLHRQMRFRVTPVLDWFHISMRVRYLEQIAKGLHPKSETGHHTTALLSKLTTTLLRCYWHASFDKAEDKIRQALVLCRIIIAETPAFESSVRLLDFRLRDLWAYIESNRPAMIAYGRRQNAGQAISTAMAESAVNQVINARICKRQQMRWTPRGHICLRKYAVL